MNDQRSDIATACELRMRSMELAWQIVGPMFRTTDEVPSKHVYKVMSALFDCAAVLFDHATGKLSFGDGQTVR